MDDSQICDSLLDHCCTVFNNVKFNLGVSSKSAWQRETREPMAAVFRTLAEELVIDLTSDKDDKHNQTLTLVKHYLLNKANEHLDDVV